MTIMLMGILAAVALTNFIDFGKEAKTNVTQKRLAELKEALIGNPELVINGEYIKKGLIADVGSIPTSIDDLVTQGSFDDYSFITKRGWRGPYVNSSVTDWNKDGWGIAIVYSAAGRTLKSCGPDRVCGGGNAADDITISF